MSTIREILLVLALLLVIAGASGYHWVHSEQTKQQQLQLQRSERFKIKVAEADNVLGRELNIRPFSDRIVETKPQDEPAQQEPQDWSEIRTASIIGLSIGSTILAGWLILLIIYGASAGLRNLRKLLTHIHSRLKVASNKIKASLAKIKKTLKKYTSILINRLKRTLLAVLSRLENFPVVALTYLHQVSNKLIKACLKKVKQYLWFKRNSSKYKLHCDYLENENQKVDVLYCDEKPSKTPQANIAAPSTDINARVLDQLEQNIRKTILAGYHQHTLKVQDSLKAQNESLEKQVAEVMQMAQAVQETSIKNSEPVKNTLDELTKQISAIREYASFQHEKIEKLQEGYDWSIIRNFCLRVIRCIDNLENRIEKLSRQNIDTTDLREIMDELVFALESSGVEQFKPRIDSDYNGKEKIAEVVKDRVCTDDPDMTGKIASVLRPGYQYVINDNNVRVVRAARVKLYFRNY